MTYLKSNAFDLKRHQDNHGKWYELHVNKRPRGGTWLKLQQLEHTAACARLTKMVAECREWLDQPRNRHQ